MDSFIFSLNATVPVFAVMVIGQVLKRIGIIDIHFANVTNKFVFKVCLPCMVFLDLADTDIRRNFDSRYVIFCFIATLASILAIWFLARKLLADKKMVGSFVQCAYRSSAAILGIAFIQNIYGTAGMAPLMIIGSVPLYNVFAVIILTFESREIVESRLSKKQDTTKALIDTIGDDASAKRLENIRKACIGVLTNPIIIGILLGLVASYFNITFPKMVHKTISNLGVMASPLALISIGAAFEGRKALSKIKPTMMASAIKLVILAGIFLPLAVYAGFRDQKLIAIIIMLASPSTPTSYIMAKNMDGDAELASSIIVATTLLSSVTLTGWIFLMRSMELIQ
ncbi:MAG: AEC family transporter [Lachnospiraceae bacterium]|nr:AEC family transporter [Lachnospiraceae bacterium]